MTAIGTNDCTVASVANKNTHEQIQKGVHLAKENSGTATGAHNASWYRPLPGVRSSERPTEQTMDCALN
jgi:hypothetical protein